MATLLSIKRRFTISGSFHVSSSNNFRLALGPHKLLHSISLDNSNGQSSCVSIIMCDDKISNLNDVLETFNGMINQRPVPSVVKFTRLLHRVTQLKQYSCSLDLFKQMCAFGFPVNKYTAGIAIKCYCGLHRTQHKHGLTVLCLCFKQGVQLHVSTFNTLFKGFAEFNYTHEAEKLLFDFLKGNQQCRLNLASYKIMIKALCKIGYYFPAIGLTRLVDHGLLGEVGVVTYNTIFDSLCNDVIFIDYAFKLFEEMVFHKAIRPNVKTYNSLIYNLCKLGRWDEVCRMLKQMEDVEVKTFNIIVDALCKQGKIDEARLVINIMGGRYPPNIATYNSLIDAYCWTHEMSKARSIYDSLSGGKCSVKPNMVTYHKLLLGYSMDPNSNSEFSDFYNSMPDGPRCDTLSFWFFCGVCHHDIRNFSTIRFPDRESYCRILENASYKDALGFFRLMDRWNTEVSMYNRVIKGAIKSRRFDEARRHFHDLVVKGIEPDEKTYEAMVHDMADNGLYREAIKHY